MVLLGCRWLGDGAPSPAADRRLARAASAIHEAFPGAAPPMVVVSGGRRWGRTVEAVAMAEALVARGVAQDRIVLELLSLSTVENARFSAELLRAAGIRRAAVVTCDWHARRALRSFAAFGVEAFAVPAPSPGATAWTRLVRLAHETASEQLDAHLRRGAATITPRGAP